MQTDNQVESTIVSDADAEILLTVLKGFTGITIPVQKKMMVLFRLRKRFVEFGNPTIPEYAARVRRDRSEQQIFINLLTTNETSFFRTPRVWRYFREEYLPTVWFPKAQDTLRIWSAAASTGEEACSVAMSCNEFQASHPSFRYQIFASDVDTEVLARAERGHFAARTAEKLRETDPDLYQKYFKSSQAGLYEFDQQLRQKIRFATHNLMETPARMVQQDIIFLRNVLIYFQKAEQEKILKNLATVMPVGAILILGESESIASLDCPFTTVQPQICRRS